MAATIQPRSDREGRDGFARYFVYCAVFMILS